MLCVLKICSTHLKKLTTDNDNADLAEDRGDELDGLHNCELSIACPNLVSLKLLGPSASDYYLEEVFTRCVHL